MNNVEEDFKKSVNLSHNISEELKNLEDLFRKNNFQDIGIKIRFPQGVLRKAADIRGWLQFIDDEVLKRNLSYHLMLADFYKWFLERFEILYTGREMLIKEGISLYGNICAAVLKTIISKHKSVKACIEFLFKQEIVNEKLKNDLQWLWDTRCKEHIEDLKEWEFKKYSMNDFERAYDTWESLWESLYRLGPKSKEVGTEK